MVSTDTVTMDFSSSELCSMFVNLGKPVSSMGPQIPLCQSFNDTRLNVITEMLFSSQDSINEVPIADIGINDEIEPAAV